MHSVVLPALTKHPAVAPTCDNSHVIAAFVFASLIAGPQHSDYKAQVEKWRAQQETDLKAKEGWLSVAGLFWLNEGFNTIGSDSGNQVVLPEGAPARVGVLSRHGAYVSLATAPKARVTIHGKSFDVADLKSDVAGTPTQVKAGSIVFTIIQRGARVGVRVYDDKAKSRTGFTGLTWFPVEEKYRVNAKFIPYAQTRQIPITNVLGDTSMNDNPGYVEFTLDGQECHLEAQSEPGGLFINFADKTSGVTTYHAGRFLDAPMPKDGHVVIDFNEAYNPPCAFTSFATCPLPPAANHLPIAIEAGEKAYRGPESE